MENTQNFPTPDEMIKAADEHFLKMMKNGQYARLLETMDTLGHYTLRNQMLILKENPNARKVNNMSGWNYKRRSVDRGQRSIKILAPTFAKQAVVNSDGTVTQKTLDKVTGYEVRFVYDESQTVIKPDKEPVPDILDAELAIDKENLILNALKGSLKDYKYGVSPDLSEGVDAVLDTEAEMITIREGMPKEKETKTLINQIAAVNVLTRGRQNFWGLSEYHMPNIAGVEIAGISYTVAKRLGLEMPMIVPDFKDMSDENISKFAENVNIIRSVSQRMIAAIENAIEKQIQDEKAAVIESKKATVTPAPEIKEIKTVEQTVKKSKRAQMDKAEAVM